MLYRRYSLHSPRRRRGHSTGTHAHRVTVSAPWSSPLDMDTTPRQQHTRNEDYYILLFLVLKEEQKHTAWRETLKLPGHAADTRHHGTFSQTPSDLVVKFQPLDIVGFILLRVLRPRVVYQREIKG